jgi:hypothetical protein
MVNLDFSREYIKKEISKIIFEEMFRKSKDYIVFPIGYENTTAELSLYKQYEHIKKVINNIKNAPDFCLISQDKTKVFLVEVRYKRDFNLSEVFNEARKVASNWDKSYLFIVGKQGFYFSSCENIINNNGQIEKLSESWIPLNIQEQYLALINEFMRF